MSDSVPIADEASANREFRVVMRGPSVVVFRPKQNLLFTRFPTRLGSVNVAYTTRWLRLAEGVTVPGHLWIEIRGCAPDLESAIGVFGNAGLAGISIIVTSTNAAVEHPEIEVAFESTPGAKERDYFQQYVPPEAGVPHMGRLIDLGATHAFLKSVAAHVDVDRLMRATNQYKLALENWKLGHAIMAMSHLWMAIEALTKARIRAEIATRRLAGPDKLAVALGVELRELDGVIRRQFILQGDAECYKQAKEASDGFEHGYLGFDKILARSEPIRRRMAGYVRSAIFDLAGVEEDAKATLLSGNFATPLGPWPIVRYLRGQLRGDGDQLAAPGNEYPFIRWSTEIKKSEFRADGQLDFQVGEKLTPELANGIAFSPMSFEAWRPD